MPKALLYSKRKKVMERKKGKKITIVINLSMKPGIYVWKALIVDTSVYREILFNFHNY